MRLLPIIAVGVAILATACSDSKDANTSASSTSLNSSTSMSRYFTSDSSKKAFSHPFSALDNDETDRFILGKSFFRIPWVEAPAATTARDGLGPLFSANTCINCHANNGAGVAVDSTGRVKRDLVFRLSLKNDTLDRQTTAFEPEPNYGGQLSVNGTSDTKYEGLPKVVYTKELFTYSDGEKVELRKPTYSIEKLQYGDLHPRTNIATHIALALVGLGFIEEIAKADILIHEDVNDEDRDGISGKANWIYDAETNSSSLGRFTWKAGAPSVKFQIANAAINDMGLTNPLFPKENCTKTQTDCLKAVKGHHEFDLTAERLEAINYYLTHLKVPLQRPFAQKEAAKRLYDALTCKKCHIESYRTEKGMKISPFSDFLLHDMGEGLSDGHRNFLAEPSEFRTPPLWGIGLYKKVSGEANYLHDGRARSIEEAILWHNGEAKKARDAFAALSKKERTLIIRYLESI